MKKVMIVCGAALMIIGHRNLYAQELLNSDLTLKYDETSISQYRSREGLFSDTFGDFKPGEPTLDLNPGVQSRHDVRLGNRTAVNYFFTRNVGIAAEGFTESARHVIVDSANGSMVFRLPFGGSGFAAYIFGGIGHQADSVVSTNTFHSGGGLEYRFNQHFYAFLEPHVVFKQDNCGFGRCGMRWNF